MKVCEGNDKGFVVVNQKVYKCTFFYAYIYNSRYMTLYSCVVVTYYLFVYNVFLYIRGN